MPAIKGDMYINTHCNYSQPTLIKLYNENIGGHLTPLQRAGSIISFQQLSVLVDVCADDLLTKLFRLISTVQKRLPFSAPSSKRR